jgi:hypothetical protein
VGKKQVGVPVTMRAVLQRLNRKLAKEDEKMAKARGARARFDLGEYFILDTERNFVKCTNVDPVAFAKDYGVLADWETIVEDEG